MIEGRFEELPREAAAGDSFGQLESALVQLADSLHARSEELGKLSEIGGQLNSALMLEEIFNYIYDSFQDLIPYERIGVALLDDRMEMVTAYWARSESDYIQLRQGFQAPLEGSSLKEILQSGRPRILNDLPGYLEKHPESESTRLIVAEGMKSNLTCPLIARGRPIGFMFFSSMSTETYRDLHVGLFTQIAQQLSAVIEKARLYEELVELNEIKNRFVGIAAHDLRSPLSIVIGYARLLDAERLGSLTEDQKEASSTILRSSESMLALVNDLLDFSSIESGRLDLQVQEVDLVSFLRDHASGYRLLTGAKGIALELETCNDVPKVEIDPSRFGQVIDNLVGNALKYSSRGTKIAIRLEREPNGVALHVKDEGRGIPKEELPNLFSPYTIGRMRPPEGEKSTGLGLAIVKRIVDAHEGSIDVQSEEGEGTRITIRLPAAS